MVVILQQKAVPQRRKPLPIRIQRGYHIMKAHKTSVAKRRPKDATARIITDDDGQVMGEITGNPDTIERARDLIDGCEKHLGCRFEIMHTGDPRTIRVNAIPRRHHQIKAQEGKPAIDPKQVLLHRIFIDDRPAFPGSILNYMQQ
jgi:hypothetical protein